MSFISCLMFFLGTYQYKKINPFLYGIQIENKFPLQTKRFLLKKKKEILNYKCNFVKSLHSSKHLYKNTFTENYYPSTL